MCYAIIYAHTCATETSTSTHVLRNHPSAHMRYEIIHASHLCYEIIYVPLMCYEINYAHTCATE